MTDFQVRPPRVVIVNMDSGDELEAQFNPETLDEEIPVNWGRLVIPGFSHERLQFSHTGNNSWTFDLRYNAIDGTSAALFQQVQRARRFLQSVAFSRRGGNSIRTAGLPRLLFLWPNLISVICVLANLKFKHEHFNREMATTGFTASVTLEEFREVRLYSEDVFIQGTLRSGSAEGGS